MPKRKALKKDGRMYRPSQSNQILISVCINTRITDQFHSLEPPVILALDQPTNSFNISKTILFF